jgi:hypothetical protein
LFKENQMLTLPEEIMAVMRSFAPVFSERIWDWVQVLVMGAILAPRQRTVCAALRAVGLGQEGQFQNYHRVLNRAKWSGMEASRVLLRMVMAAFVPENATLVFGADDTLERRRGKKIRAKGHFRDSARSSQKWSIAGEGLRWLSLMLLTTVPWSQRAWALPILTVLSLHPQASAALGKRHKTTIDLVLQLVVVLRRWLPLRRLVLVTDGALVAVKLGLGCRRWDVTFISRLHLNLRFFDPPVPKSSGKRGKQATVGQRQPTLEMTLKDPKTVWQRLQVNWYGGQTRWLDVVTGTALWQTPNEKHSLPLRWVLVRDPRNKLKPAALMSTDLDLSPQQIIAFYVLRWNLEVTFQEARAHLGVESQRQWSDLAIERTTPALLGLFSLVTLLAHHLTLAHPLPVRATAWYTKSQPSFVDALAIVRRHLWTERISLNPRILSGFQVFPTPLLDDLLHTLCYAT